MKKRALSLLLVLVLAIGLLPLDAAAEGENGADYQQLQLAEDDFTVYTKSDYPWTYGGGLFKSGNADDLKSISRLKIVANKSGLLTFDWAMSSYKDTAIFAYRLSNDYSQSSEITKQKEHVAEGKSEGTEEGLLVNEGEEVYFAYYRTSFDPSKFGVTVDPDEYPGIVAISNLRIEEYIEPTETIDYDTPIVFDSEQGTVTAQLMEKLKDESGYNYYHLSTVDVPNAADGNTYRLQAVAKPGYQFYGWVQTYMYNGQIRKAFKGLKYYTLTERDVVIEETGLHHIVNDKKAITDPELEVKLDGNSSYEAIFAPTGSYLLRKNAEFYDDSHSLAEILEGTTSGDVVEVLKDAALSSSATVKKGVTLYVPFRSVIGAEDEGNGKYRSCGGQANKFAGASPYVTLTITADVTLTVNGKLAIGSVHSSSSHSMQGHISGKYGRIDNNGLIAVSGKGTMITYGLVTGSGVVRAENYGVVKEPVVVCDFTGGSNSLSLYTAQQMPFKRYTTQNIQCELQLERLGTLTGMITLYALGGFNEVETDVMGVTDLSIFKPNNTGVSGSDIVLRRTYQPQYLKSGTWASEGIGKVTYDIYGGLEFHSLTLELGFATVKTDHVDFAIPSHMDFVMHDGLYDIPGKLKLMPGSHMTVESDATLKINGKLIILDGLKQGNMSSSVLTTREQFSVPGYGGSAEFVLNGTLRITEGSILGGVIQSTADTGLLIIEEGAYLKNSTADLSALDPANAVDLDESLERQTVPNTDTWVVTTYDAGEHEVFHNWVQQDGGKGGYSDNTTWFNLPARIYNGTEVVELTPGTWKSSVGNCTFTDVSHQRYCTNGGSIGEGSAYINNGRVMTVYDDTFERTVQGVWTESSSAVEITSNTVAGSDKSGSLTYGVTVETVTARNADGSTTLTLRTMKGDAPATEKYVHLVKYVTATGTLTATGSNGVYTIPAEGLSVTIESALLGDANGDGKIYVSDITALRLHYLSKRILSGIAFLAGDINADGKIAVADITQLRLHYLGKKKLF